MPSPSRSTRSPIESVSDASGLAELIDKGVIEADRVIAVIGKTEGNGGVNDYTRIIADRAFREVLVAQGHPPDGARSSRSRSSGPAAPTGSSRRTPRSSPRSPRTASPQTDEPRLSVGYAMSEQILPEDIGRLPMVEKVAAGVKIAMERAGITDPATCTTCRPRPRCSRSTPSPTPSGAATTSGPRTPSSRWTSPTRRTALGIAVALGEIEMPTGRADPQGPVAVLARSPRCSSGVELDQAQIVVLGNVRGVGGRFQIGHSVMKDALDADGVWDVDPQRRAGRLPERPHSSDLDGRVVNVFCKCEADPTGRVRDRRNIMLDDSDVHWHRQIKSCVGGVVASVTGDPAVFVSVAAVHQGPSGGGPVIAIVEPAAG